MSDNNDESSDFSESEISELLEDFMYVTLSDTVDVVLINDSIVSGEIISLVPKFMIKTKKGVIHSISVTNVLDTILVKRGSLKKRTKAIMKSRDQFRNLDILSLIMLGFAKRQVKNKTHDNMVA